MKITDNTRPEIVSFRSLPAGSVFKTKSGGLYLKFPHVVYEEKLEEYCEIYNAYDLICNVFTSFDYTEDVMLIQAELILTV